MFAQNPALPPDPYANPLVINQEQMTFIYTYYPQYQYNMHEILIWLYHHAIGLEQQRMAQMADEAYTQGPSKGGKKTKKGKGPFEEGDIEEETQFLDAKQLKKMQKD